MYFDSSVLWKGACTCEICIACRHWENILLHPKVKGKTFTGVCLAKSRRWFPRSLCDRSRDMGVLLLWMRWRFSSQEQENASWDSWQRGPSHPWQESQNFPCHRGKYRSFEPSESLHCAHRLCSMPINTPCLHKGLCCQALEFKSACACSAHVSKPQTATATYSLTYFSLSSSWKESFT